MIDLETLSTSPKSAILTIGAVKFSRAASETPPSPDDSFYRKIDLSEYRDAQFEISDECVAFWEKQSDDAKRETFKGKDRVSLKSALSDLSAFMGARAPFTRVWSNGSVFDIIILENAFRTLNLDVPWKFWNVRDVRTMLDVSGQKLADFPFPDMPDGKKGQPHHAISDCMRQIEAVQAGFKRIS